MTVVIATYNSEKFLPNLREMFDAQKRPANVTGLEILAVDGGSTDETRELAKELGFTVIDNPRGNPIAAKFLGLNHAQSRLVCFLDHDEQLVRRDALAHRYELFAQDRSLRAVISAGYRFDRGDSTSNMYASEFGDPVSLVVYRCPNNETFRTRAFSSRLRTVIVEGGTSIFEASSETKPILCEMAAGSGVIDADFYRKSHPSLFVDENLLPHAYYLLDSSDHLAIVEGDSVTHQSADSWRVVRAKIKWRLANAINGSEVASSGFSGRAHSPLYSPRRHAGIFLLYSITLLPPVIDSLRLAMTRRRIGYLNHFVLTYYVLGMSVAMRLRLLLGRKTTLKRYGH